MKPHNPNKSAIKLIENLSAFFGGAFRELTKLTDNSLAKVLQQGRLIDETLREGFRKSDMDLKHSTDQLLTQARAIESANREGFARITSALENDRDAVRLISDGLKAHRDRYFANTPLPFLSNEHLRLLWTDKSIRWPHRRILEFLARQWCFNKREFKEVHQNEIVRQANIARSTIKNHLTVLLEKGLIERREDHGRIFYRINGEFRGCADGKLVGNSANS